MIKGRFLYLLLLLILFIDFSGLKAQPGLDTLRIREIRIEGKKSERSVSKITSSIDSNLVSKSVTLRLSELLLQNTPIFIKEYGRGAMATASFRGTAPSHTKVSWNGLELNSPMLGMVDFSLIPVYFINDVKLLHGSSSLHESAGALGGTIQLRNNPNWSNQLSGKLISGFGSFNTFDEYFQVNYGKGKIQSKHSLFLNSSSNNFSFVNKLNADIDPRTGAYVFSKEVNRNADYKNFGILEEFYIKFSDFSKASLKTWIQHNERSIPQLQSNETIEGANINRQNENALRSVLEWEKQKGRNQLRILSAINLQSSNYLLTNQVSGSVLQTSINADALSLSFVNKINYKLFITSDFTVNSGVDANLFSIQSSNKLINDKITGYDHQRLESSVYLQFVKKFTNFLNVELMARELLSDGKHQALLPLTGFSLRPILNKPFILKGSFAFNKHLPTLNDLYFIPGGNPELKAESGISGDFSLNYSSDSENRKFHLTINTYYSAIKDWILWLPSFKGFWEPKNLNKVISKGIEANWGLETKLKALRIGLNANYGYTRSINQSAIDPSFGRQLPYIPVHSANLSVHLALSDCYFDWFWNYYSKRYTTTSNSEETISDYLYPYFMNTIQFGTKLTVINKKISVECKIFNLFNESYRTVLQRPMPGRNYLLVLQYDF